MRIHTRRCEGRPAFVMQKLAGVVDRRAAALAAAEALEAIRRLAADGLPLNVVFDLRRLEFAGLEAHRTWSESLRGGWPPELPLKVAVIGRPTERFAAERDALRSQELALFTDLEAALAWLAT